MAPGLALVDQAVAAAVDELYGVFNGEDVGSPLLIDAVEQRRQGGALAGAGGAGDQNQPLAGAAEALQSLAAAQCGEGGNAGRHRAEGGAEAAAVVKGVDAKAGDAGQLEGEVRLRAGGEGAPLRFVHDGQDDPLQFLVAERRRGQPPDVPIHAHQRRQARRQVQVRCALLHAKGEQLLHAHFPSKFS